MLGAPVTYYPKSWEGTNGFIISADLDELFIDSIESVQVVDEDGVITTSKTSTETDLSTLNDYLESTTYPTISYAYASNMVHIFISSFSYVVTTKFVVFGYRSGIPIKSLEDELDIPESHIELFKKYAIKEAAQLRGRIVPASILADINELENSLIIKKSWSISTNIYQVEPKIPSNGWCLTGCGNKFNKHKGVKMFISDTTLRDVKARRIQVIVDAKFETLTIQNFLKYEGATAQMAGSSNNVLFPAGTEIIGEITAVQLSQGAILVN